MKKYNELDMEVVLFDNEDDICVSGTAAETTEAAIPRETNDGEWA